jgi:hypothetical protein
LPMPDIKPFVVVTGHYGSGKTNVSINLALDFAEKHGRATLVDLDVVNPYFRSSEYSAMLEERGVHVISPNFAGTTLDAPSLSPEISSVFGQEAPVVIDAGGDDVGATALGRYARQIATVDHDMLYVINRYRNLTSTPAEAAGLLGEIEAASRLTATGVVNNSHLRDETTLDTVRDSLAFAYDTAALLGLPLICTTLPKRLTGEFAEVGAPARDDATGTIEKPYAVEVYVRLPWEDDAASDRNRE